MTHCNYSSSLVHTMSTELVPNQVRVHQTCKGDGTRIAHIKRPLRDPGSSGARARAREREREREKERNLRQQAGMMVLLPECLTRAVHSI